MDSECPGTLRVGPAGWSYADWNGIVYPAGLARTTHPLAWLARWFDTVEINSSFYRPNDPRHAVAWLGHVAALPDFRFTAKIWQAFTHHRDAWPGERGVAQVREGLAPLRDARRLGAVLAQFPWSFKRSPENRHWLARVLDAFADFPVAVELRHASWERPEVYAGLAERGVAWCNIDQPIFADSIEPGDRATSGVGYIRLHGRNRADWFRQGAHRNDRYNYLYSDEELAPWVERARALMRKTRELYVVTNNHFAGQAVANAIELQQRLKPRPLHLPPELVARYPRLGGLPAASPPPG
jgi:uncharacterized protein YecE (DUF72 family)